MNNLKLIYTVGLPASGKSTWAKEQVKSTPGRYKRINKDDLREMLDVSVWSKENEKFVLNVRNYAIEQALSQGYDVIVDDTNFADSHVDTFNEIAKKCSTFNTSVKVEKQDFTHVPLEECIKRDKSREKSVGEKVIRGMYNQYLKKKEADIVPVKTIKGLTDCILIDVDGTLCKMGDRSPFEWMKVHSDTPHQHVIDIVKALKKADNNLQLIIFSGRDSVCKQLTEEWLKLNGVPYDEIFMRKENDNRKDFVVKEELYNNHIKGKYNVKAIFDDRLQVCELWYKLGLPLFRVGDPNANF